MANEGDAKLGKLKKIIRVQKEAIAKVKRKSKRKQSEIKLDEVTRISAIKKGAALKIAETALKEVEEGTPTEELPEASIETSAESDASAEHTAALADTAPPAPAEAAHATHAEVTEPMPEDQHAAPAEGEQPVEEAPPMPEALEGEAGEMVEVTEGEIADGDGSTKTSGLAIVALVFAFIFPLLGAILGLAAMAKIKKDPNHLIGSLASVLRQLETKNTKLKMEIKKRSQEKVFLIEEIDTNKIEVEKIRRKLHRMGKCC